MCPHDNAVNAWNQNVKMSLLQILHGLSFGEISDWVWLKCLDFEGNLMRVPQVGKPP